MVDPVNNRQGELDVAFSGDRVAAVDLELNPDHSREVFDASGKLVFSGLVDSHVHLTPMERGIGFRMLAKAGVTVVMANGVVLGRGGAIVTTERGEKELRRKGVPVEIADFENSLFYNAPEDPISVGN